MLFLRVLSLQPLPLPITTPRLNLTNKRSRKKTLMKPKITQKTRIALSLRRKKAPQRNLQNLKTSLDLFLVHQCLELHGISNYIYFIYIYNIYLYETKKHLYIICEGASFGREMHGYFSTILLHGYLSGKDRMILLVVKMSIR